MPIVAVAVAVVADIAVAGSVSAAIAGTITIASALEMTAALGATLSAIGAVTHDKTLSKVGMYMGIAGGVGSLAVNAGVFGSQAGSTVLFGNAPAPGTAAAGTAGAANAASSSSPQAAANVGKVGNTSAPAAADASAAAPAEEAATSGANASGGLINGSVATPVTATPNAGIVDRLTKGIVDMVSPSSTTAATGTAGATGAAAKSAGGFFGSDMAKYGMIQAAGAFLSGATDEQKDITTQLLKQQYKNLQDPMPVAARTASNAVSGAPTGLINKTPAAGTVTGAVR